MGVPIFSGASRLEFYRDGSGIISLIKRNTSFVVIFFLIDRWLKGKKSIFAKLFDYVVMTFLFLSMIGTGAKSAFLIIVYTIIFYRLRLKRFIVAKYYIWRLNQIIKKMSIIALIVACIVLSIEMNVANIDLVLLNLCIRLVAFAMIRVVNYSDLPENVGLQLWQMLNGYLEIRGPNPRHNVFGYLHFGIFVSVIYSFIIGISASYVRNRLFQRMASNLFLLFVYMQLYMFSTGFAGDISTTLVYFWSFLLIDGSFFCFIYVFYRVMTKRKER